MEEQNAQDLKIIQIDAGENCQKRDAKYERLDTRLTNLLANYSEETKGGYISYLDNIAHNIRI